MRKRFGMPSLSGTRRLETSCSLRVPLAAWRRPPRPRLRDLALYAVLSRGLVSGHWRPQRDLAAGDFRSFQPRFSRDNIDRNLALVERLREIAGARRATVAQVAIAWVLAQGDDIVALVGARRRERAHEALGALDLELTADDLDAIEGAVPAGAAAGDRYAAPLMADLDSER